MIQLTDWYPRYTVVKLRSRFWFPIYHVMYDEISVVKAFSYRQDAENYCIMANIHHKVGFIDAVSACHSLGETT